MDGGRPAGWDSCMKASRVALIWLLILSATVCVGQWGRRRRYSDGPVYRTEGGDWVDVRTVKTAREIASHSTGTPEWTNPPAFSHDVFTFVRIIRDRDPESSWTAGEWITDYPDSDLNLSFRLQQMTSMKVDPDCRIMRLTDPDLCNFPFIYMVEPGSLILRDEEVPVLRNYLLNGGVLWADDFWGEWQWDVFARQLKRVFPDRDFQELPMSHEIFHDVFNLNVPKNKLQTPNIRQGIWSEETGVTWETHPREDGSEEQCTEMHVRALFDDKGHIMVLATHNCDNGDSWEREGESDYFFHTFSENRGYPLAINVLFYLMTH